MNDETANARRSTRQLLGKIPNFPGLYRHELNGTYYAIKKIAGKRKEHSLDTTDRKLAERRFKEWVYNGTTYTVAYIAHDGAIVLENGRSLKQNFKNFEWGYALTSHASQGRTFDRIFIAQSAELSAGASDLRQFLVSISRGSKGVKIYTDDIELLREYVARERERLMATELMREDEVRDEAMVKAPAKSSALLGTQPENSAVEMEPSKSGWETEIFKTNGKGQGMNISGKLGEADARELTLEAAAELARIQRKNQEKELQEEMVMTM